MAKDYAKKRKPKKRGASRKAGNSGIPAGVWLLAIIFVGGLIGGLTYLKLMPPQKQSTKSSSTSTNKKSNISQPRKEVAQDSSPDSPEIDDDFPIYNVHEDLVNRKVEIPEEDLKPSEDINKYIYLMPCGSFRERERAEELKATIAMTGNSSDINKVKYKGEDWYRVELGPFNRKRQAEKVRHRLQDNNVHDCRIIPRLRSGN
ncbi:SPOR domain-containing protein [Aliikangiella sp. G2MR2-5]|uniref:SPOR domain-containing protein n=1 Tax=Aliikangiella sp. G2MR2-5 TaxID=2788943 RepID=UPI0018A9B95E|nr:SPOR domain-containing protein [Aliikangiella sp. G2MR2-5]